MLATMDVLNLATGAYHYPTHKHMVVGGVGGREIDKMWIQKWQDSGINKMQGFKINFFFMYVRHYYALHCVNQKVWCW